MFNFSANHIEILDIRKYDKCTVYITRDVDTNRCYKAYDYSGTLGMRHGKIYCISGKVNSADKLYLVLEHCKEDHRYCTASL
ncbi:MAG TPA: hypothetical protein GX501_08560 [Clostridiaceae bacterium]|nr:hypothetical protein [Clostridiaceae bacterium]